MIRIPRGTSGKNVPIVISPDNFDSAAVKSPPSGENPPSEGELFGLRNILCACGSNNQSMTCLRQPREDTATEHQP